MQFDVKNAAIIWSVLQQIPLYYSTKTTNFFVRLRKSVEYLYNNHYLELILLWVLYGLSFFSLQTDSMFQIADSFGKKKKKCENKTSFQQLRHWTFSYLHWVFGVFLHEVQVYEMRKQIVLLPCKKGWYIFNAFFLSHIM